MKERSLFWPLALIAAGTIWLLANMRLIDEAHLWALAHYLPFVLIALGVGIVLGAYWPAGRQIVAILVVIGAVAAVGFAPYLGWDTRPGWAKDMNIRIGGFADGAISGSGKIVPETRQVTDFTGVVVRYNAEVVIRQGESAAVVLEADDNLLPQLTTLVRNGVLYIENSQANAAERVRPTRQVRVSITVRDLRDVEVSAASTLRLESLRTDQLKVSASGAVRATLNGLSVRLLDCRLSGATSLTAKGVTEAVKMEVSGASGFEGAELAAQAVSANLSGASNATVWAQRELTADVSGASTLSYYGQPTVQQRVSLGSSVRSRGNK